MIVIEKLVDLYWGGWKRKLLHFLFFVGIGIGCYVIILHNYWMAANGGFLVLAAILYFVYWKEDSFSKDVEENEKIRQKMVGMIFYASEYIHVPPASNRTKPLFFRKSQRILDDRSPEGALTEWFVKYLLRNYRHLLSYMKIIGITIAVMVYLPLWMEYGLFVVFFFFIKEWLNIVYDEVTTHPFLEMQKGKKLLQDHFQDKVTRWLYYPACGIVGFFLLINTVIYFTLR